MLGNEEVDFKTKLEAYKKGVVIIDKSTFNRLMDYYSPEVKEFLEKEEALKKKYEELRFEQPKDALKFLDKESKSLKSFLQRQKSMIISGKGIRRETGTTYKNELKERAELYAMIPWIESTSSTMRIEEKKNRRKRRGRK